MSYSTKDADRAPWWARRRVQASVLAATALVATGAAAQASSFGDGFLAPGGGNQTMASAASAAPGPMALPASGMRPTMGGGSWNRYLQGWTWSGTGVNRFAFRTLGDGADPTFNQLLGVNDGGRVVGYFGSGADAAHPNHGYRVGPPYQQRNFVPQDIPGAVQTQVVGVNNGGDTVGFYVDSGGANHGFVRQGGRYRTVDFPGTTSSPAFNQLLGINGRGMAVGFWNDAAGNSHGYLYDVRTGRFRSLRLPVQATSVVAAGINDRNHVVGFFQNGKVTSGFIWAGGQVTVLRFGNRSDTQALGINNADQVVGSFVDTGGTTRGFLRVSHHLVRIVTGPGATSTVVNGLDNSGLLVGFYTDPSNRTLGLLARR